jgi:hypothetical protein
VVLLVARRPFIFDQDLVRIDNVLATQTAQTLERNTAIDARLFTALNGAAPIYRKYRWKGDDDENRKWIDAHSASIAKHAPSLRAAIAGVFEITPPQDPGSRICMAENL